MMESAHAERASIPHPVGVYSDPVRAGPGRHRPGIPPTPAHLGKLIQLMKDDKVKVIIVTLAQALQ
jgi:hypothetical protein